jgi:hypothetical protein
MTAGDDPVREHQQVCLYDDTDYMAFGPTFDSRREADAFIRWFERPQAGEACPSCGHTSDHGDHAISRDCTPDAEGFVCGYPHKPAGEAGRVIEVRHLARYLPDEQKAVADAWRAVLEDHPEAECPWDVDRDSYGIGYTGDSDRSYGDYTEARPDSCECECHRLPGGVFSGR